MLEQLRKRTLAPFVGAAVLLLASPSTVEAFNPQPEPPGHALGAYRGYSQSDVHPDYHPYMELTILSEDDKGRLSGVLTMGSPVGDVRFAFRGNLVDDHGRFKGRGFDPNVGEVKFEGVLQALGLEDGTRVGIEDMGDGGALARAHYKFTDVAGNVDMGTTLLLRSFDICSGINPCCLPSPDVTGDWTGTTMSRLVPSGMALALHITDQHERSFTGIAEVLGVDPEPFEPSDGTVGTLGVEPVPFSWSVVGTVDERGNIVLIGVGDLGFVEVGAEYSAPDPASGTRARIHGSFADGFVTGARDLGVFDVAPP